MSSQDGRPIVLPASFDNGLIQVRPVTSSGDVLSFFTDTGGGQGILRSAADRLGLLADARTEMVDDTELVTVPAPSFRSEAWIPPPDPETGRLVVLDEAGPHGGWFVRQLIQRGHCGLLGQRWFGGRIWEIDYPADRLVVHPVEPAHPVGARGVSLGFPTSPNDAARMPAFPRIQANVEGETLDLLFDTGAHGPLTAAAIEVMGVGPATVRATSFLISSIFDRWRATHPEWRVIDRAEESTGQAMIEVPTVNVSGFDTGPIWFTRRSDANFTEWMSQWMDRTIVGALGGNALGSFRVILDYPAARATFHQYVRR
jgi:hypothetical protein